MSVEAVSAQTRAAAQRCGASVKVWCAVHTLHDARTKVVAATARKSYVGHITAISDDGFKVGMSWLAWREAEVVQAIRPTLGLPLEGAAS